MSHTATCDTAGPHAHGERGHTHHAHGHGHSHGLVEPSIMRSRAGVRVVARSLAILGGTALAQAAIYVATGSVALLADLIHNAGDALTALPLGAAFVLGSARAERGAGVGVVLTILVSAIAAGVFAVLRIVQPLAPTCSRSRSPAPSRIQPAQRDRRRAVGRASSRAVRKPLAAHRREPVVGADRDMQRDELTLARGARARGADDELMLAPAREQRAGDVRVR